MRFGLVIGADGAGSVIRRAMQEQVGGFTVKRESIPNYVTMLTLDGVGDRMDSSYLHAMSIRHFYVAGAINGDDGPATARWFCAIGSNEELDFSSAHAVSWISQKTLFENPLNTLRSMLTMALGQNVVGEAKRTDMSYAEVRQKAEQLGPLWR